MIHSFQALKIIPIRIVQMTENLCRTIYKNRRSCINQRYAFLISLSRESGSVDTLDEVKVHRRAKRWFRCSSFKSAFRPIKKAPQ